MSPVLVIFVIALPLSALASEGVTVDELDQDVCPFESNGCSVPGQLPMLYKRLFTPACHMHDVCYRCNKVHDWEKIDCDTKFWENMYFLCEGQYGTPDDHLDKRFLWNKQKMCNKVADGYHTAVQMFGESHWDTAKPDWCKKKCVKKIGDPRNHIQL
ncbi:conodipine-P3 isoform X2 [Nematostella vectensis]|nr:conodipine-P3 isoform X2 [Nematostella vectensis]